MREMTLREVGRIGALVVERSATQITVSFDLPWLEWQASTPDGHVAKTAVFGLRRSFARGEISEAELTAIVDMVAVAVKPVLATPAAKRAPSIA